MARQLTDPDGNQLLEWTETVSDVDGDFITFDLILKEVNDGSGFTEQNTDSSDLEWLSYETNNTPNKDGSRDYTVRILADANSLVENFEYKFELIASDPLADVSRTVILSVNG